TLVGSAHWGRVHYRVMTPQPVTGGYLHSTLVEFEGVGPDRGTAWYREGDRLQDPQGAHQFPFNVQPQNSGEFGKGSSYDWSYDDEWHCAEWHVDGDQQRYRFFFDGEEITQIAIDNGAGDYGTGSDRTHLPTSFSKVSVGWNNYQSAP